MHSATYANKPLSELTRQWRALHEQAAELAQLAQLSPEPFEGDVADFPVAIGEAGPAQIGLAWQSIEDIDAMMQPGLTALRTITARGQNANVPALALWREFHSARSSVLALTTPDQREAA